MVDAPASGAGVRKGVLVQVQLRALNEIRVKEQGNSSFTRISASFPNNPVQ
tara:strand:- start:497 stop:649 length:153 start_codon:yes stop_codon:yes gene_type:complete